MVLAAVAAVAFRDVLNLDSIKRWFNYRALMLSDSGQAEAFVYDGSLEDTFAVLDGDLLVCSQNAISLYSGSGTQYVSQAGFFRKSRSGYQRLFGGGVRRRRQQSVCAGPARAHLVRQRTGRHPFRPPQPAAGCSP